MDTVILFECNDFTYFTPKLSGKTKCDCRQKLKTQEQTVNLDNFKSFRITINLTKNIKLHHFSAFILL